MTYKVSVTDVFGNVVYSTVTGETSCAYTLENPVTLSLYTAHVIAVSKDKGKRHGKLQRHQTRRIHDSSSEIRADSGRVLPDEYS